MLEILAHITPLEVPAGVLLMALGAVVGFVSAFVWQRNRSN